MPGILPFPSAPSGTASAPNPTRGWTPADADSRVRRGQDRAVSHLRPVPDQPSEEGRSAAAHLSELLTRAGRGDESAFAEWYDATAARAFGLAVRVLRDRAQAEEVTQESYLDC